MITSIFCLCYKSIGKLAFITYLLLLIYPYVGYNIFALMLLFIIFYLNDKKIKHLDIIEPILISMMFLTKQTLGLLVIPSLIFSKNRKKTLSIYLIFIFSFLIYLIINGTVYQFFDYCLFGMFDFAEKNSTSISLLTIAEILIIIGLIFFSFSTKRKDIFYCLIFQIMALPIVNHIHFLISFVPVAYLFLKAYDNNKYITSLVMVTAISFFLTFNIVYWIKGDNYQTVAHYKINNFMKNRVTYKYTDQFLEKVNEYMELYDDYQLFTFGSFSYLVKISFDLPINKYDLINDGNMGYNGAEKYLEEIKDICTKDKCLFIINKNDLNAGNYNQINDDILKYVIYNNNNIYIQGVFIKSIL